MVGFQLKVPMDASINHHLKLDKTKQDCKIAAIQSGCKHLFKAQRLPKSFTSVVLEHLMDRASLSNEEALRTLCLLRTGTLTNRVYEVNNSTAALPEQLRVMHSGIKVTFIPEKSFQIGSALQYFMSIFPQWQVLGVIYKFSLCCVTVSWN